jgi:hypothetical protein
MMILSLSWYVRVSFMHGLKLCVPPSLCYSFQLEVGYLQFGGFFQILLKYVERLRSQ